MRATGSWSFNCHVYCNTKLLLVKNIVRWALACLLLLLCWNFHMCDWGNYSCNVKSWNGWNKNLCQIKLLCKLTGIFVKDTTTAPTLVNQVFSRNKVKSWKYRFWEKQAKIYAKLRSVKSWDLPIALYIMLTLNNQRTLLHRFFYLSDWSFEIHIQWNLQFLEDQIFCKGMQKLQRTP